VALSGGSQWSDSGGDPVAAVESAREAVRAKIGIRPNTLVMGASVYAALKFHEKLQAALGANERKLITVEHLKALFGISDIRIGEALAGDTTTGDIWGDNVVLVYVPAARTGASRSYDEPSWGYTLRLNGMPETDRYDADDGKVRYVRHTDIYKAVIVGADAGQAARALCRRHGDRLRPRPAQADPLLRGRHRDRGFQQYPASGERQHRDRRRWRYCPARGPHQAE
jgi:hypothetical protein